MYNNTSVLKSVFNWNLLKMKLMGCILSTASTYFLFPYYQILIFINQLHCVLTAVVIFILDYRQGKE